MNYVVSDIHGCYDKYLALLERIHLQSEDTLYVLGDMIDRGPDGLKVLQDVMSRPNVVGMLGNHEFAAISCLPWLMNDLTEERVNAPDFTKRMQEVLAWQMDGGDKTITAFRALSPARREQLLTDMQELLVYTEVDAGDRTFVLVHAGLEHFSPERDLDDYRLDELICARPDVHKPYFPDKYLVFGHTPTPYLFAQTAGTPRDFDLSKAQIFRKGKLIGMDCGCVFGGPLGCLCLDTLEEFYV